MGELGIILFILSVLLFLGGILFLIILSIMNKPLKPAGIVLLASALLFLVSFTLCSTSNFNL